jgi:hypothetical protein
MNNFKYTYFLQIQAKMILVETVLGMGRGAVKEEQWRE